MRLFFTGLFFCYTSKYYYITGIKINIPENCGYLRRGYALSQHVLGCCIQLTQIAIPRKGGKV
jgi:hypothetical protein